MNEWIRPQSGSLTSLVWTPDGTQLAAAGGNGSVVFGQVIERSIEWDNFEVYKYSTGPFIKKSRLRFFKN